MHGIILHEEHRARMKKLGPERVGQIIFNLFRIDDGEEPISFPDDEALDTASEWICGRFIRDLRASDRNSKNGSNGGAPKGNHNAKKQAKTTEKQPKNNQKTTENNPLLPITNNLLPITNNQIKEIKKESDPFAEDVISYLNFKTGRHYRLTDKTLGYINGRVNEGYTTEDFKKVIDKKVNEWMGTDYEKYLQPSTLFAPSHFDNYLNQPEKKTTNDMFDSFLKGGFYGENDEGRVCPNRQDDESRVC